MTRAGTTSDVGVQHGRRDSALRRAAGAGAVFRLLSVAVAVVTVRVAVDALGNELYGVAATLATITGLLGFADLGIGQGLLTKLALAHGRDDEAEMRGLVSSAWSTLLGIGAVVAAIGVVLTFVLPWTTLLGAPSAQSHEITVSVLVFFLATAAAIPFGIGQRVLVGLQRGAAVSAWLFATTVTVLIGVCAASALDATLPVFVFATVGLPMVVALVQTVVVFGRTHLHLRPTWRDVSRDKAKELLTLGGLFLTLSIAVVVAYQTDAIVVSSVLGAATAAVFLIALRLFTTLTGLFSGATQQMWPALAEALAREDLVWVRSRFVRVLAITTGTAALISLFLVVFGRPLVRVWLHDEALVPPISLLVPFAIWTVYSLALTQCSYLLNAARIVRPQVVMATLMAVTNVPLSIYLTHRIGLAGPLYGSLVSHIVFVGLPSIVFIRRVLRGGAPVAPAETA